MLWQLRDRLSPTLKTSSLVSHSGRGGKAPAIRRPVSPFLTSVSLAVVRLQTFKRWQESHQRLCQTLPRQAGQCFAVGRGQRWVRQILCTTKARSLLVWRMADSPGCVDKLLITTNGNIIHLSLINSYFWETNKQKVICPQQDDIHSSAATSWHLGSWSLISTKGCGYDPQPVCLCWFSLATPASLCSPKTLRWL